MINQTTIEDIAKQFDNYEFETFITEIMMKYFMLENTEVYKKAKCILVTQINNDGEVDSIIELTKKNNKRKHIILQISKGNKKIANLSRFITSQYYELYKDLNIRPFVDRYVMTVRKSRIDNNKIVCKSGVDLKEIVYKVGSMYKIFDSKMRLKNNFIGFIAKKTEYWSIANKFRCQKKYKEFNIIRNEINSVSWDMSNFNEYLIKNQFESLLFSQAHERRVVQKGLKPCENTLAIERILDSIYFKSKVNLKESDLEGLKCLVLGLNDIVNKINYRLKETNSNDKLIINPTSTYLGIKLVNTINRSNFRVIGYFNYLFNRRKPSYGFNFLCVLDEYLRQLSTKDNLLVSSEENKYDNRNFRGKTYLIMPNINDSNIFNIIEKLLIKSIEQEIGSNIQELDIVI